MIADAQMMLRNYNIQCNGIENAMEPPVSMKDRNALRKELDARQRSLKREGEIIVNWEMFLKRWNSPAPMSPDDL